MKKDKRYTEGVATDPARAPAAERGPLAERLTYPGGFPVYLARYVLFGGKEPRAALRFFNASEVLVTGLKFRLAEKDGEGNTIAEYPLERRGLFAERGSEFAVADVPVGRACVSVEVQVQSVLSEPYEYVVEKDGVRLGYGVTPAEREYYFREKPTYSLSKRRKIYVAVALCAVLGSVLFAGVLAWRFGAFSDYLPEFPAAEITAEGGNASC